MSATEVGDDAVAPAKLTLSLRVLGTRSDGFHELEALTVSIDAPADRLSFAAAPVGEVRLALGGATADVPDGPDNLVVRAARSVLPGDAGVCDHAAQADPARRWARRWVVRCGRVLRVLSDRHRLDREVVERAAETLGSDVPFCLHGSPAWMRGRGEILERVELAEPVNVLVVVPPFGMSTPAVYRAWDELGGPKAARAVAPPAGVAALVDGLVNDLEAAAAHVEPRWIDFRVALEAAAEAPALLAGSGSACWLPFDDPDACRAAGSRVERDLGLPAFCAVSL